MADSFRCTQQHCDPAGAKASHFIGSNNQRSLSAQDQASDISIFAPAPVPAMTVIPSASNITMADTLTVSYSGDTNYNLTYGTAIVTITPAVSASFALTGASVSVAPVAITVIPAGGFTGSIALTASITSSPTGPQYLPTLSFGSTTPVSIMGPTAGTATLANSTTAATSATASFPQRPGIPWCATGGTNLALFSLLGVPGRRRKWQSMIGLLLLCSSFCVGGVTCGGSGGVSPPSAAGTTPGIRRDCDWNVGCNDKLREYQPDGPITRRTGCQSTALPSLKYGVPSIAASAAGAAGCKTATRSTRAARNIDGGPYRYRSL
jgi:hypothetical protein